MIVFIANNFNFFLDLKAIFNGEPHKNNLNPIKIKALSFAYDWNEVLCNNVYVEKKYKTDRLILNCNLNYRLIKGSMVCFS